MRLRPLRTLIGSSAALCALIAASPAGAHHSFAMFDFDKTIACTATVKEFRWTNPHVTLLVEAEVPAGAPPEIWSLELTSPGNLTRLGWNRHTFKPGDRIELKFNPLRDGKHGGAFKQARIAGTEQVFTSSVRDANETPNLK